MVLTICSNTPKLWTTAPLGAALYGGGVYLSQRIPQALVAGAFSRVPAVALSLASRVAMTLGRGVHVLGAIAVIAVIHKVAKSCSFENYLQSSVSVLKGPEAVGRDRFPDVVKDLPWDQITQHFVENIEAMLSRKIVYGEPLDGLLPMILGYQVKNALDRAQHKGTVSQLPLLTWLFSGKDESQKPCALAQINLDQRGLKWNTQQLDSVLGLLNSDGCDDLTAKLLTWTTGFTFVVPIDAAMDSQQTRVQAYLDQVVGYQHADGETESSDSVHNRLAITKVLVSEGAKLSSTLASMQAKVEADDGVWEGSAEKQKAEAFISRLATKLIEESVISGRDGNPPSVNLEKVSLAQRILGDVDVKTDIHENLEIGAHGVQHDSIGGNALSTLLQALLQKGAEDEETSNWNIVCWLTGISPEAVADSEGASANAGITWMATSEENKAACKKAIYKAWKENTLDQPLLAALLLTKQALPTMPEGVKQHREQCLSAVSQMGGLLTPSQVKQAVAHLCSADTFTPEELKAKAIAEVQKEARVNTAFIHALVAAGAEPIEVGNWAQDEHMRAAFALLAKEVHSDSMLPTLFWLTGVDFRPIAQQINEGPQDSRALRGAFLALAHTTATSLQPAYYGTECTTDENWERSAKEMCVRLIAAQQGDLVQHLLSAISVVEEARFQEVWISILRHACEEIEKLKEQPEQQRPYTRVLEAYIQFIIEVRPIPGGARGLVESKTTDSYRRRLKQMMDIRLPSANRQEDHTLFSLLAQRAVAKESEDKRAMAWALSLIGVLQDSGRAYITDEVISKADRKAFFNARVTVEVPASAEAADEATGPQFKERSALRILFAGLDPSQPLTNEMYELCVNIVCADVDLPAQILCFEQLVEFTLQGNNPWYFSNRLREYYEQFSGNRECYTELGQVNIEQLEAQYRLQKGEGHEETNLASALNRCLAYATAFAPCGEQITGLNLVEMVQTRATEAGVELTYKVEAAEPEADS